MESEKLLASFISKSSFKNIPPEPLKAIKNIVLNLIGATIAGSAEAGCEAVVRQVKEWGGKEESTIFIYGGKVPAHNAVLANAYMARALDIDDSMLPGIHPGASTVTTALAVAEKIGGCSGEEFLTALVLGHEVAARMNLAADYDGFDPTGIAAPFGTAAVAARLMKLDPEQILNALALVFNRSAGSFQSNVDGALSVRAIQGFSAQSGVIAAELARIGITGPRNFIDGIYGYFHLYAKDKFDPGALLNQLGQDFLFPGKVVYKKHPSCACTEASTDAILFLVQETGLTPENVKNIDIKVSPHVYKLVGHPFVIGQNPRVDAQFNLRYCVASALTRKKSSLKYFEEDWIRDPQVNELTRKINVSPAPELGEPERMHFRVKLKVITNNGDEYTQSVDHPRGTPEKPLTEQEFLECFQDYISYGKNALSGKNIDAITSAVGRLEQLEDVRSLIDLLLKKSKG